MVVYGDGELVTYEKSSTSGQRQRIVIHDDTTSRQAVYEFVSLNSQNACCEIDKTTTEAR